MDVATKRAIYIWAVLAVVGEAVLVARGWPALLTATAVAGVSAGAAFALDRRAIGLVLFCTYLSPAIIWVVHGDTHPFLSVIWFAAVIGVLLPDGIRSGWAIPAPWRTPLVFWALVVAVAAPIVIAREIDFNTALLARDPLPSAALGSLPSFSAMGILHVGLTQVLGILWFDWLFQSEQRPHAVIAGALAASAAVLMLTTVYQALGNMTVLNTTVFGRMGRASGTLFDANLTGMIAAMWIGVALVPPALTRSWPWLLSIAGAVLGWLAVLATGSRTAQIAAVIVTAFGAMSVVARTGVGLGRLLWTRLVPLLAVLLGVVLALGVADIGPIGRLWQTLPDASLTSWQQFAFEMWNRYGYGSAAWAMIREFPWFGVGIGSFQTLLPFFSPGLVADNAQNWARHLVAELGIVGAAGALAWAVLFAAYLVRSVRRIVPAAWPLLGALLAFGLVGLVGVPGQDLTVALTFWTVAFWFVSLVGPPALLKPVRLAEWSAVLALLLVFAIGTFRLAETDLRAPVRSERIAWPYTYGFYWPERDTEGNEYRWAQHRAVSLLDAPHRQMTLTVRVPHAGIAGRPVDFKAWIDGREVISATIRDGRAVTADVEIPTGRPRVRLETWASREVVPADEGFNDDRHLAAMVGWTFHGEDNPLALGPTDEARQPLSVTRLVPNTPPPVHAGIPITWTALTVGGPAPQSFQFWVVNGSNRTLARDWDPSNVWTWTPLLPGDYSVEVWARSAGSTRASDARQAADMSILAPPAVTVMALQPSATPLVVGQPVNWNAVVAGGHEPYSYQYWIWDGRRDWQMVRDWNAASSWLWTPPFAGRFSVAVWIRNAGSSADRDASYVAIVDVSKP